MMLAAAEAGEMFLLLEGEGAAEQSALSGVLNSVREPWLARGLLQYHARTGSARALYLLARGPELQARHALDALSELLRGRSRTGRRSAAAALARLVAARPSWLHSLSSHLATGDLIRLLRHEQDAPAVLDALLALVMLLPTAPGLVSVHWADLAEAFARLAAWDAPPHPRAHLQLALYALFHTLYATYPCTLLEFLRAEYGREPSDVFRHTVLPMLESVRLHPSLVTGSRSAEAESDRWARSEPHDVLAECRRYTLDARREDDARSAAPTPAPRLLLGDDLPEGSGALASRECATLRPGSEGWFCLSDRCGAESAPHTPLPASDVPGGSPPEAAVEATPENTPVKEVRTQFKFPSESSCVRVISRFSQPPSPLKKETSPLGAVGSDAPSSRLARVVLERAGADAGSPRRPSRAAGPDSPVPIGMGAPMASAEWPIARPEPSRPDVVTTTEEPLNVEDREVLELTSGGGGVSNGGAGEWGSGGLRMPRGSVLAAARGVTSRLRLYSGCATGGQGTKGEVRGGVAAPKPRARSCPALSEHAPRLRSVTTQTIDAWPATYEFLLSEFYQNLSEKPNKQQGSFEQNIDINVAPSEKLDTYLTRLYDGEVPWAVSPGSGVAERERELLEQLALTHAQLMYERWRREAHSEMNRRLLGRCRQARGLEQKNAALRDRLVAAHRDADELRIRLSQVIQRVTPVNGLAGDDRCSQLEAELKTEADAHARTAARLEESERERAIEAGAAARWRAEAGEAGRRLAGASSAARLAERRGVAVRGLRRELVLLGEREARLAGALAAEHARANSASADHRLLAQYREELSTTRSELAATSARAEAMAAREGELEAALATREAAAGALRREARAAGAAAAASLSAVQDKYYALMHVVRRMESRRLERLAGGPPATPASPHSSPLSASLASAEGALAVRPALSDVSRCRNLLEDDEDTSLGVL